MSDADRDSKRLADILQSGELPDLSEFARLLGLGDEYLPRTKDPSQHAAMQKLERLHARLGRRILDNKAEAYAVPLQMQQVAAFMKMLGPTESVRGMDSRINPKPRSSCLKECTPNFTKSCMTR